MGYYVSDSDIDLSDRPDSDNHSTIRALGGIWTLDDIPASETTSASGQHNDISSRRKKYTKTRAPTPHRPQPPFINRFSLGR